MATYPFQLQPSPSMRESGAQKGAWWQNVCFVFDLKRSSLVVVVVTDEADCLLMSST